MDLPSPTWLCLRLLLAPCLLLLQYGPSVVAQEFLVGYGNTPYDPACADTCYQSYYLYLLSCSKTQVANGPPDPLNPPTTPACYSTDEAYLTSVAWCVSTKCAEFNVPISKIEDWWARRVGRGLMPPKWTYSVTLTHVDPKPPKYSMTATDTHLNRTSLVDEVAYLANWNAIIGLTAELVKESTYSIVLFVVAVGLPMLLTWIQVLPFVRTVVDRIKPYLVYPSVLGRYQVRPLPYLLGNAPTTGQTLYMVVLVILNILLSAVDYVSLEPNAVYLSQWKEIVTYILTRTGAFAFVLLPVLLLFSSRNNILLIPFLSNWSHSTYMLLHRWVARLFMVHVVIHSICGLEAFSFYKDNTWWHWGIVGTVFTVVLTIGSGLWIRKLHYELFLITHVMFAVFVIVGSWYHLIQWYALLYRSIPDNTLAYEIWLWLAIAVWFFDRLVRVGRVIVNGGCRATVTELPGGEYVRIDVPKIRWGTTPPGRHVFVYFPTLVPWRPWENHPFSIVPTVLLGGSGHLAVEGNKSANGAEGDDKEKQQVTATATAATAALKSSEGITLFVKKEEGMTKYLQSSSRLLTLLDGPYSSGSTEEILRCDKVLIIAGGIGITGALGWAHSHWNVKLAWSVREGARGLAEAVDLSTVVDKEVRIGSRFNVEELIAEEESAGWARVGVVVCGPGGLCDDTRAVVAAAGKRGKAVFELEVDAFSW